MATSGTWTGVGANNSAYTGTLTVAEVSYDSANNTSIVEWGLRMDATRWQWFDRWYVELSVMIDGNDVVPESDKNPKITMQPATDAENHSYVFFAGQRLTVQHNTDGKKNIECSASLKTATSKSYLPGLITIEGGTITLTDLEPEDPPEPIRSTVTDRPVIISETGKVLFALQDVEQCTVERDIYGYCEADIICLMTNSAYSYGLDISQDPEQVMYPGITNFVCTGELVETPIAPSKKTQLFRVYNTAHDGTHRQEIKARHISYDMAKIPVKPFTLTDATPAEIMAAIQNNAAISNNFVLSSVYSTTNTYDFTVVEPTNMRALLFDGEESVLGKLDSVVTDGNELIFIDIDNYNVTLCGPDYVKANNEANSLYFLPGVNMLEYNRDEDDTEVYKTGVLPYWHKNVDGVDTMRMITGNPVVVRTAPGAGESPTVEILDVTEFFDTAPSDSDLTDIANQYMDAASMPRFASVPVVYSAKLKAVDDYDSDVDLMHYVHLRDPAFSKGRTGPADTEDSVYGDYYGWVTKLIYNVLSGRIDTVEASNFTGTKKTLSDILSDQNKKTEKLESDVKHIQNGTSGGGGGGTTDYNRLSNKPQVNNVTLSGNKTGNDLGLINSTSPTKQTITFTGNDDTALALKSGTTSSYIELITSANRVGYFGINPSGKPVFYDTADHILAYASDIPSGGVTDVEFNGSSVVDPTGVARITAVEAESDPTVPIWAKQPNKPTYTASEVGAMGGFTKSIYINASGNPRATLICTVDYNGTDGNNAPMFKFSMIGGHGNAINYLFYDEIVIAVGPTGDVTCNVFKYYGLPITYESVAREYGDIFYTIDTAAKVVRFYALTGQYSYIKMTPYFRVTDATAGTVTQASTFTQYSSGTKVWANIGTFAKITNGWLYLSGGVPNDNAALANRGYVDENDQYIVGLVNNLLPSHGPLQKDYILSVEDDGSLTWRSIKEHEGASVWTASETAYLMDSQNRRMIEIGNMSPTRSSTLPLENGDIFNCILRAHTGYGDPLYIKLQSLTTVYPIYREEFPSSGYVMQVIPVLTGELPGGVFTRLRYGAYNGSPCFYVIDALAYDGSVS